MATLLSGEDVFVNDVVALKYGNFDSVLGKITRFFQRVSKHLVLYVYTVLTVLKEGDESILAIADILLSPYQLCLVLNTTISLCDPASLIVYDEIEVSVSQMSFTHWQKPTYLNRLHSDKRTLISLSVEVCMCSLCA